MLQVLKRSYIFWFNCYDKLPKVHRYSLGKRIDNLFVEAIEMIFTATFLKQDEKLPYVKVAIRKCDAIKFFLLILFETDSLKQNSYIMLSESLDEVGRMLGGWHGSLVKPEQKQNSTEKNSYGEMKRVAQEPRTPRDCQH